MGCYLTYGLVDPTQATEFNEYVSSTTAGKLVTALGEPINVSGSSGKSYFKVSGLGYDVIEAGFKDFEEFFDLLVDLFVDAETKFELWFDAGCEAFRPGDFLTGNQARRLTKNGKLLIYTEELEYRHYQVEKIRELFRKELILIRSEEDLAKARQEVDFILKLGQPEEGSEDADWVHAQELLIADYLSRQ